MIEDSSERCVLSLQKFPKELRKKLKMKAAELEIDLQDLCVQYLRAGLEEELGNGPTGRD